MQKIICVKQDQLKQLYKLTENIMQGHWALKLLICARDDRDTIKQSHMRPTKGGQELLTVSVITQQPCGRKESCAGELTVYVAKNVLCDCCQSQQGSPGGRKADVSNSLLKYGGFKQCFGFRCYLSYKFAI